MKTNRDIALCPFCGDPLNVRDNDVCPTCRTPHHNDCWRFNNGCTTFGCEVNPTSQDYSFRSLVSAENLVFTAPSSTSRSYRWPIAAIGTVLFLVSLLLIWRFIANLTHTEVVSMETNSYSSPTYSQDKDIPISSRTRIITLDIEDLTVTPVDPTTISQPRKTKGVPTKIQTSRPKKQATSQNIDPRTPTNAPPSGHVIEGKLNVRRGPGAEYAIITQLVTGTEVSITGHTRNKPWWRIRLQNGDEGWVSNEFIYEIGCISCVPYVNPPPTPRPTPTPKPPPTKVQTIASNRQSLNGSQGAGGWKYLMETARNSGSWKEMSFDGNCYRTDNWEHDVRICQNGEVHPGQSTRIAYEWRPPFHGNIMIDVHAHKIDTNCGDGIWIGTYRARDGVGMETELDTFFISGSDNIGKTRQYSTTVDPDNLIYIIVDIHRESTCDLSRVFIDIRSN